MIAYVSSVLSYLELLSY